MTARRISWLIYAAVAFGVVCRVAQYGARTSLWHDESFVALNVVQTPYSQLLGPLDWHEPSPPGFLAVEKLMLAGFGRSEYTLRFVPLVAAIAGTVVFAVVAAAVNTNPAATLWGTVLMAGSAKLIVQANETKHFALDLTLAAALVGLAIDAWRRPNRRTVLTWGVLATVGIWFAYATAFTFAGTSLALAVRWRRWASDVRRAYFTANALVGVSLAALAEPIRRQRSGSVVAFWAHAFPDLSSPLQFLEWFGRALIGLFDYFWQPFGGALLVLFCVGVLTCWRSGRRAEVALLCLPVVVALAAAFARVWPFGGNQHMVFAAPALLILCGEGVETTRRRCERWRPRAGIALVVLLLGPGIAAATYRLAVPRLRHELRPVIKFVQARRRPGDTLIVFDPATFAFYTGVDVRHEPMRTDGAAPVWVITPRSSRGTLHTEADQVVTSLGHARTELGRIEVYGAAGYLFGPPRTATPSATQ